MFPPMLLHLRIGTPERSPFGLWLPLFLIWLLLLPIVVLVLVVAMAVDILLFLVARPYHHYTLLLVRGLGLLAAVRGLVVSIHDVEHHVVEIDFV
jgi:hypothetical protein